MPNQDIEWEKRLYLRGVYGKKKNDITIRSSVAEYLTFNTATDESGVEAGLSTDNI